MSRCEVERASFQVSWSPDSKRLLSASGDKTCKVWDVESGDLVADFVMGAQIEDQQLSCFWTSTGFLVSVSLSGFINFLDLEKPGAPSKVVKVLWTEPCTPSRWARNRRTVCPSLAHQTFLNSAQIFLQRLPDIFRAKISQVLRTVRVF